MADAANSSRFQSDGSFVSPSGRLTRKEVGQATLQFTEFDVDGDGLVSFADFSTAMAKHNSAFADPSKRGQLETMYKGVDLDGNGRVDVVDFMLMRVRAKQGSSTPAAAAAAGAHRIDVRPGSAEAGGQNGGGGGGDVVHLDLALIAQAAREDRGGATPSSSDGSTERSFHSAASSLPSSSSGPSSTPSTSRDSPEGRRRSIFGLGGKR